MLEYFPTTGIPAGLVGVGYSLRADSDGLVAALPALGGQVQVVLRGRMEHQRGFDAIAVPPVALVGPTSRAFAVRVWPGAWVIGCGVLPAGWVPLAAVPAREVLDRVVDLEAVWPKGRVRELHDAAARASTPAEAVAVLAEHLRAQVAEPDPRRSGRVAQIEAWLADPRHGPVEALAEDLGVGRRQLSRVVGEDFGCAPKLLQIKYRALRISVGMALRTELSAAAVTGGSPYFDQSHLIQDFRRFVGTTPTRFAGEEGALSRFLIRSRLRAGARTPTTLWS